ncbi:hypothetical protein [Microbacterium sp. 18062]|uniref:hypothetical protein n=1 Tax=Microbacterium sp. 18062 TaxID=2681410 RepID=UPI0013581A7D|nr:hypothetical protein [Microbacterium sp. 18062]
MSASSITGPLLPLLEEPVLRIVPEGTGPYPGEIVSWDGRAAVAVPVADLDGTELWKADGEHVAAPWELVRTPTGLAVLLPPCGQSVADLAARRAAGGHPFAPGEVVTLVVSILRGSLAEHGMHPDPACRGRWWMSEDGTPLFVHEPGAQDDPTTAADRALRAIEAACEAEDTSVGPVIGRAREAVADPERLDSAVPALEDALFASAAPAAVGTQLLARRGAIARPVAEDPIEPGERRAWRRLADAADAGIAEMASEALTSLWRSIRNRPRSRPRNRRGALMLAAAAGALVVAGGLLWPADDAADGGPGTGPDSGVSEPSASDAGTVTDPAVDLEETAEDGDVVVAAGALLESLRGCGGDADCLRELRDQEGAVPQDGAAFAESSSRRLTLLDDVGGLALLRADDASGTRASQIVAIVRHEHGWVLRDIHDVAQHPG